MTRGGETGSETHEDRIWTVENSPNPPTCKILSEETDFHQCLLKMEIHPITDNFDNNIRSYEHCALIFSFGIRKV